MAFSLLDVTVGLLSLVPNTIKIEIIRRSAMEVRGSMRDLTVVFEGLAPDEARTLIDAAIKIEQARTGDVLTPTEYGNRFSGLDLEDGPAEQGSV